jgi:hypothetical protein
MPDPLPLPGERIAARRSHKPTRQEFITIASGRSALLDMAPGNVNQ